MSQFGEVITAMVTPFDKNLNIDYVATKKLISHLLDNGTDSIVVSGTTGESPTLSKDEKLSLFKFVKENASHCKVIANIGTNNTSESIEFARLVEMEEAADGLLLVNPYYNKPTQEGLYQHFKAIATSTSLPIMLYNIPGRTSVNLNADTTLRLAEIENITSIKESSGNLSQVAYIIENAPDGFSVYSGDDNLTLPILSLGGVGVVSVASHIAGVHIKEMIKKFKQGDHEKAATIHRKLLPFFEGIFFVTNPVPIKRALELSGVSTGGVRLPLVNLTDVEMVHVEDLLRDYKKAVSSLD